KHVLLKPAAKHMALLTTTKHCALQRQLASKIIQNMSENQRQKWDSLPNVETKAFALQTIISYLVEHEHNHLYSPSLDDNDVLLHAMQNVVDSFDGH
ncbi:MAG: hypothetical protein ACTSUE_00675, partial [Promethearchaeota archaeon]